MSDASQKDVEAIRELQRRTEEAENSGDVEYFNSGVCTDDVVVMPPNMPVVVGPVASVEFMREFLRHFDLKIHYVSEETQVHGDFAFDRGSYSHTLTPRAGGAPLPESGKYLWLYARANDEDWKLARVMWSPNDPAPSP